ncbi:hypothetical protein CPB85DRAFT_1440469 [Mucidula mucida]|nr:hypothetical protein CPB85DRAFT_1440469 [Mucidula mucida]
MAWVLVAYILTVIDSFSDVTEAINANKALVHFGFGFISPKCDSDRLQVALTEAYRKAFVATSDDRVIQVHLPESRIGKRRAFTFLQRDQLASPDESCTSPIFNYARAFPWARNVETLATSFCYASEHADHNVPVKLEAEWDQLMAYWTPWPVSGQLSERSHLVKRMAIASPRSRVLVFSRLGKTMAALNSVWIVVVCIFQFSNVFDRCYCNSSVLGRGVGKSFNTMQLVHSDQTNVMHAWIGGVALALISALAFVGFVQIYIDPPMHSATEH